MPRKNILIIILLCLWTIIAYSQIWNNPHSSNALQNVGYDAFAGSPKTLDPARSYSEDEMEFIAQIYEPTLQYNYLKRPYSLMPLTAQSMPQVTYYDSKGHVLPKDTNPNQVAYSIYDIYIKPHIYYQPHPAFAKDQYGNYLYHHLTKKDLTHIDKLNDFPHTGTRELIADDYVYQIKRLASPTENSPILGFIGQYISGLLDYNKRLQSILQQQEKNVHKPSFLDLRQYPFEGAKAIDRYHYQIKIKGVYPQFMYWLAMTFFSPMPWEAHYFYSQPKLADRNFTLDWYPVGTGPYMLTENNPNKQMILQKNPNFHGEKYPTEGEPGDAEKGYLINAGKPLPFVDEFNFSLDKESIPRWNKFLQGYYDKSEISPESFDQAIKLDVTGKPELSDEMKKKGIRLQTTVVIGINYLGFNMLDDVVGGYSEKNKKLRQAISIALNYEEYISIFLNGRGLPAQGPLPPGIFGYDENNINPVVYYRDKNGIIKRRPVAEAKKLLAEAGYSNGIDPKTGKALILNYDVSTTGSPDDKTRLDWMRKEFAQLGIDLNIRSTDYNRFQDKVRTGNAQMFSWGWLADYPDPENFLFVLYGPNGKVKFGGENAANYSNPQVDRLFQQIKNIPNSEQRKTKINELIDIAREDSPWVWGYYPIEFSLAHAFIYPEKLNAMTKNTLKYERIDVELRAKLRKQWNPPVLWPFWVILGVLILIAAPLVYTYWKREHTSTIRRMEK